jgi:hypothetical protein
MARPKSEPEKHGMFRQSAVSQSQLFGAGTAGDESKINEKWSAEASAINCGP